MSPLSFTSISRRFARREQGSVLIETALLLSVILIMAFGIVDFGRVMYLYNALTNATRDGARWTAVQQTIPATTAIQDTVRAHFNSYTFGGPTLTQANVAVTPPTSTCTVKTITILSTYPFNWITPVPRLLRWTNSGSMTTNIHATAIFKYEWCA